MKKSLFSSVVALAAMLIVVGCSTVDGDYRANEAPSVRFINNELDADSVAQVYDIDNYSFLFSDIYTGFEEDEVLGQLPDTTDLESEVRYELIRFQYFRLNTIRSISYRLEITDTSGVSYETGTVPVENYRVDENIPRYLWIHNTENFHWTQGSCVYTIDGEFEYRPVFSYAPMIFWTGSDADGFVERYRYYDLAYTTDEEQAAFEQRVINDDATIDWTYTVNTQAEIYLTTQLGQIQKHKVFLQAQDDEGALSEIAVRTFNRSNRAPNTPELTFQKSGYTLVTQPDSYTRHVVNWQDIESDLEIYQAMSGVTPYYEIPMNSNELPNWGGLGFLVTCDDPDDQALVTIPLQFEYRLHRLPEAQVESLMDASDDNLDDDDDMWENGLWINDEAYADLEIALDDTNVLNNTIDEDGWSDDGEITLYNLDNGFYQLTVFSRDDGLEPCALPGYMRFRVVNMSMERDLLVINLTSDAATLGLDYNTYLTTTKEQLESAITVVKQVVDGAADYVPVWYDGVTEEYNCRWWAPEDSYLLPYSVMAQYHSIIVLDDNWAQSATQPYDSRFTNAFKGLVMDYLDQGGSLFWTGHSSLTGTFGFEVTSTNALDNIDDKAGDFLFTYMGISKAFVSEQRQYFSSRLEAFVGALHEQQGFEDLRIADGIVDVLRGGEEGYDRLYTPARGVAIPDSSLAYVEALGLNSNSGAEALYTFNSYSSGLPALDTLRLFVVADSLSLPDSLTGANEAALLTNRDPNPTSTGCWLRIFDTHYESMEIQSAYDAYNNNRNDAWADPVQTINATRESGAYPPFIYLTYQYTTQPWAVGDTVSVYLRWNPILEMHRKPVISFVENQEGTLGIPTYTNFRTCFSTVPLYAMEPGEFVSMTVDPETQLPIYDLGSGANGLWSYVLYRFYLPKVQDSLE